MHFSASASAKRTRTEFDYSTRGRNMTPTSKAALCARAFAALLLLAATSIDAQTQPYSADAMWRLKRLADPAISPDGRLAVVPVTTYDINENKANIDLWLVPTKPGRARQLTSGEASDTSPAWSPDGQLIAFVSTRGDDEQPQLYVIPVDGGEARRVTNVPTGVIAPKWFPDSRRIAFLSQVWTDLDTWVEMDKRMTERSESKMTARVWEKAPVTYWDHFLDDRQTHIYSIDIDGGEPQPITRHCGVALDRAEPDANSYDISPDGTEVAFAVNTDRSGIEPNFDIFTLPVEGGSTQNLKNLTQDNPADDTVPVYSPDGRSLAFRRQLIRDFYADRARL